MSNETPPPDAPPGPPPDAPPAPTPDPPREPAVDAAAATPEAAGTEPSQPLVTVPPEGRVRAFLAVNFPITVVRRIVDQMDELRPLAAQAGLKVAWVPPANLHVTLKFLGTVRGEVVEAIRSKLGRELPGRLPFDLEARGLGAFPAGASSDAPRVLWAGVGGAGEKPLRALASDVERWMEELGFPREQRAYHPHVTLGRVMSEGPIGALLSDREGRVYGTGRVAEIVIYESRTLARGAEYRPLGRVPLGQPGQRI